jgi:tetratricopeptide (TPR) repeat protein
MQWFHKSSPRSLKLIATAAFIGACLIAGGRTSARNGQSDAGTKRLPPIPTEPFSPSNARTEDGKLIPVEQFFPASRCASCHQDTHRGWSESLHRNAAREPFYRESADILLRTRGIEFTRHCESCHTPVALFSGVLTKGAGKNEAPFTPLDDEGVTCTVCHSITEARLDGTGSFTIRRPALLAKEDGAPVYGDFTDEQILADVPGHKRAVMRPLLKSPEFCSTCHKVDAPPSLNGYKHIRGFSAYDEWQQSGASHESLLTFYKREERADCRACHMPKIESANDRSAKQGKIASHRWLGANTAAPFFYNQTEQAELTKAFLQNDVVELDIFALKRGATGETIAPLYSGETNRLALHPGEEVTAEVVVSNRNAGHSFPPEVRDLYEAWVEFEAIDAAGKTIFHSGFIKPDGMLDESAHVYKTIILDEQGRHITRHQIWTTNIKAYDNTILPGRSDVVRFRFRLPDCGLGLGDCGLTLRGRVNYRRLNQEYTAYVLRQQKRELSLPVVRMAEALALVVPASAGSVLSQPLRSSEGARPRTLPAEAGTTNAWKRWNDYGIGLLEQSQFSAASEAFRRASALDPQAPDLLVNAAIAEMRTERFGPELDQFRRAAVLLDAALKLNPAHDRALFYLALVRRAEGNVQAAADALREIAGKYPRDREVQRQFALTLYSLGRTAEARSGFERILSIDPTDFLAHQFLAPLYASEGREGDSERARALYFQWRDDPRAESIAARFFAAHPEWADARNPAYVIGQHTPRRPVLTGAQAVPER